MLEPVTLVLERAEPPMRAREIHRAAEQLFGHPLRWPSVRAALSAYTIGPDQRFRRVGLGIYEARSHPDLGMQGVRIGRDVACDEASAVLEELGGASGRVVIVAPQV